MSRDELNALLAASTVQVTRVAEGDRDPRLSASRNVAAAKPVAKPVERKAKAQPVKRNWAAQARYDAQHGTVNGYDPRIQEWNDFHRNEMGDY